ncbi:MAG: PDZ domain-containing protein [Pirellulaceae bacterium]
MKCIRLGRRIRITAGALALVGLWIAATCAQEDLTALEEQALRAAVERVAPCVVRIETLGGLEQLDGQLLGSGPTTGLIVAEDGYILSSAFAFAGQPSSILVTLPSGQRVSARIVARDTSRMLVLLKVTVDAPLPLPAHVPRAELAVGQWTVALGRTYPGSYPNVSVGVLCATNRVWGKAVQTDAKISPSNYGGPLIDIRGRVIGVLVPLSPQQEGEFAGAEWYDSGIGFAVPLADIWPQLDRMKQGTDLQPGLLGISLAGSDIYALPAKIAACPAKSPARAAGLQPGDTIVEIDGIPIERQSQLRHALGPRVAGDTVRLVVVRGETQQRIETTIELVATIEPYVRPEMGLLPMRTPFGPGRDIDTPPGVRIRHVFPGGPAATAGLQAGDRIVAVSQQEIGSIQTLRDQLITWDPGQVVRVRFLRGEQAQEADLTLGRQTMPVPEPLPPALEPLDPPAAEGPAVGVVPIQIPEVPNKCLALVPDNYDPLRPYGLVVWLHPPGKFEQDELVNRWKQLAQDHDLIVLAPQSADEQRWLSTEIEFIRKAIDDVMRNYSIDPTRVVLHGYQAGGAMAYYVAFNHRDVARAVAPVASPLPTRLGKPTTDPVQPLALYSVSSEKSVLADRVIAGEQLLGQLAFPVLTRVLPGEERYLNEQELTEFVRWIDGLDRI